MIVEQTLETYFSKYKKEIIGDDLSFVGPYGEKKIIYADWTASGRLYRGIEEKLSQIIGPYVANTHTETTLTGSAMTHAYHQAREIIKKHVNAGQDDVLITEGSGMTGVISKFQRILGLRISDKYKDNIAFDKVNKPVVFVSHMEHHSNQTSWHETIAEVVVVPPNEHGLFCLENFENTVAQYAHRTLKIASITAASNVTGIRTPFHEVARIMHSFKGLCFVDFACSAPYVEIDMHPEDKDAYLDAVFFSPHKFLGGPASSGVLVFNKALYDNEVPDNPGGGTVTFTNPWGGHGYFDDIETREDGGTPAFMQTIRVALAIQLKEKMGVQDILDREHEQVSYIMKRLKKIPGLEILAGEHEDRLGIFSFYIEEAHFNLVVKVLNDRFGIQTRGGCSCAGTYGHYLLHVDQIKSGEIVDLISQGCLLDKPGWIRMSIHPTTTNEEIKFICDSIEETALNINQWKKDYIYNDKTNEYRHRNDKLDLNEFVEDWFSL
ncbi:MAG: aminotransferase class V-fold PLP-dependent enzyme [Flavobacteriaceae bacterium]